MSANMKAATLPECRCCAPQKLSEVDLATAIVVTEVELEHVRRHGTVTQELQCLARLADLKLQMVQQ